MIDSNSDVDDACKSIQDLVVWYPCRALIEGERAQVEEHVAACPACAELLRFATSFKTSLQEQLSSHPESDALVCYAEGDVALDSQRKTLIEAHLAICPDCREQVAILKEVEGSPDEVAAGAMITPERQDTSAGRMSSQTGLWGFLRRGVLRPAPAAVYLAVAVLAIALHIFSPSGLLRTLEDKETGDIGLHPSTGPSPFTLGGTVILPDEDYRTRQPGLDKDYATRIDAGKGQFLMLELTGLQAPPPPDDLYIVEVVKKGSSQKSFEARIRGRDFSENYTICLSLKPDALTPGEYVVMVVDPDGRSVFRSSVMAR